MCSIAGGCQSEIPAAITVGCQVANFSSNSRCTFTLPGGKDLPADMRLSIGNGPISAQACTVTGQNVTCPSIPSPNSVGILKVYVNTGGTKIDTGETVKIVGPSLSSVTWGFTPEIGNTAPLFKSTNAVTVKLTNFKSVYETAILPNTYVCNLEYRALNDQNSNLTNWTKITTNPISYDPANGCQFSISKAQRGNTLNQSLRLTITKSNGGVLSTNPEDINTFFGEYLYRFEGAGVALGGV